MSKTYKMQIDTKILELLGPSLYTNIYYVLAELIANAYDAQAKNVYIIEEPDNIIVEDDGLGMTYQDVTNHYLAVARSSRETSDEAYTKDGKRRKMGRKGIGKLAALSVSENVLVQTRAEGDTSGFILSRHVNSDGQLKPLTEEEIKFRRVSGNGTSVVMLKPEYKLHRSLQVVKKNIAKIFPAVSSDFKIHIIRGNNEELLASFDMHVLSELCAITTLGDNFSNYGDRVLVGDSLRDEFISKLDSWNKRITLTNRKMERREYNLEIQGWIGAYRTSRGRKVAVTDFPDNHIALYANNKLGEFNILPMVGQNRLNEVYVVGALHIDLFEETELPDMALSNRQGYKSDDERYIMVIEYVRKTLLPDILSKRDKWTARQREARENKKLAIQKEKEKELRDNAEHFRASIKATALAAVEKRLTQTPSLTKGDVVSIIENLLNQFNIDFGLKPMVDGLKKKLLISHTSTDSDFADVAYKMLQFNGIPAEDMIYTSSDNRKSRIPRGVSIFDYLRMFFVESVSKEMVYVVFITSERMSGSWAVLAEIGAAWITRKAHHIFNIRDFIPKAPLNTDVEWQSSCRDSDGTLYMTTRDADVYCDFIAGIARDLGHNPQSDENNKAYLKTLIQVR